jgi:hypothetical protein
MRALTDAPLSLALRWWCAKSRHGDTPDTPRPPHRTRTPRIFLARLCPWLPRWQTTPTSGGQGTGGEERVGGDQSLLRKNSPMVATFSVVWNTASAAEALPKFYMRKGKASRSKGARRRLLRGFRRATRESLHRPRAGGWPWSVGSAGR